MKEQPKKKSPEVWAVGGGKGGVGKSIISVLLSFWLAKKNKETVLVDLDLGGANIHTLMGIKSPARTLNDFIIRKYNSLEEISIYTEVDNLRLLCGASEILSMANPQFAQKVKIIQNIFNLDADYVVIDLGAGTSFNVLDFFMAAHKQIVVLTPQPVSIQNAYGFVRNTVYRKLSRLVSRKASLVAMVKETMDPKNDLKIRTINELLQNISNESSEEDAKALRKEIANIQPVLITNMTNEVNEKNAGRIIKTVSERYLMINPINLGGVAYDKQIYSMVTDMVPLTKLDQSSEAFMNLFEITGRIMEL